MPTKPGILIGRVCCGIKVCEGAGRGPTSGDTFRDTLGATAEGEGDELPLAALGARKPVSSGADWPAVVCDATVND